ncbi:MAG TPA: hypothetical protein VMH89_08355, partial [Candidatus Acidoferrum sp.]|nr:hypothetical protein [Candidatus Acidoferrum sp.]
MRDFDAELAQSHGILWEDIFVDGISPKEQFVSSFPIIFEFGHWNLEPHVKSTLGGNYTLG